ncbi:MAG TPA: hypothetical protein DHV05_05275 [Acholeplasmataceae bacterium]|nr:hypothetical protein [Acholeplasmataceae bacterium]
MMKKMFWMIGLLFIFFGCTSPYDDLLTVTFIDHTDEVIGRASYELNQSMGDIIFSDSKEGYTFIGWQDHLGNAYTSTSIVTADVTLRPKFVPNNYTLSFEVNGGTPITSRNVTYGSLYDLSSLIPEKEGYTFCGWFREEELNNQVSILEMEIGNVTLYAKWCDNQQTLTYHMSNGLTYDVLFMPGEPFEPWILSYIGFEFVGWFEEGESEPFDFSSMPKRDVDVYEKLEEHTYVIHWVTNQDYALETTYFKLSDQYLELNIGMIYNNQELMGWYRDAAMTIPFDNMFYGNEEELTLYAQWSPYGLHMFKLYEQDAYAASALTEDLTGEIVIPSHFRGLPIVELYGFSHSSFSKIVIPETVEKIKSYAFSYMKLLEEVVFEEGSTLEEIEMFAFYESNLKFIKLPDLLHTVGYKAFAMTRLHALWVPASVIHLNQPFAYSNQPLYFEVLDRPEGYIDQYETPTYYGYRDTFVYLSNIYVKSLEGLTLLGSMDEDITNLVIPSAVGSGDVIAIGDFSFYRSNLVTVEVESLSNLKTIGFSAFEGSYELKTFDLPEGLEIIGNRSFSGTYLDYIHIPSSVISIGHMAFTYIWKDEISITFGEQSQLKEILNYAFYSVKGEVGDIIIPASVEYIGIEAFSRTTATSITFEAGSMLKELGDGVFRSAYYLTSIVLPEGLEKIGSEAFYFCTRLTSVYIPSTVHTIGERAFGVSPNQVIEVNLVGPAVGFHEDWYDEYATVNYIG